MAGNQDRQDTLIRQLQRRQVAGVIDTTGPSVLRGAGFEVTKLGTGYVQIDFDRPFKEAPTVIVTAVGGTARIAQLVADPSATSAQVGVNDHAGASLESVFHFGANGR